MAELDKTNPDTKEGTPTQVSLEKMVPKFCTAVNIALLNNKKTAVLTMIYHEGEEGAAIIDRVALDIDHVASLRDTLNGMLEDIHYEQSVAD
jgi:hypothetical protein